MLSIIVLIHIHRFLVIVLYNAWQHMVGENVQRTFRLGDIYNNSFAYCGSIISNKYPIHWYAMYLLYRNNLHNPKVIIVFASLYIATNNNLFDAIPFLPFMRTGKVLVSLNMNFLSYTWAYENKSKAVSSFRSYACLFL